MELRLDGAPHPLRVVEDEDACAEDERAVLVAPASMTLQALIHLRRRTGHPGAARRGRPGAGRRGETEIIGALSPRHAAKAPA